ncbi:MAG: helix-turn-helix domain-containing protein [Bdellovibrionales bacterium]
MENRIREVRKARGLGLNDLAKKIGVSMSAMSKLETGQMQLTVRYLEKISKALDVAPASLLPTDPGGPSMINNSLLAEVLTVVKEILTKKNIEIDPARHAAIVTRLYETFLARAEAETDDVRAEANNIIAYESLAQRKRV